jgi:type IV pilus assembly protein PilO
MSTAATLTKANAGTANDTRRGVSELHLHWLGVALLVGVNVFLLARLGMLWHDASTHDADALAQQRVTRTAADAAAVPLRGVDAKVAKSTANADRFYKDRLPVVQSQVLAELGELAKKNNVRMVRVSYPTARVLVGSADELTELKMDASLSGDYRPLVQFINGLERDKMFFLINGVTLTGQQGGLVSLRLGLTTYLRGGELAAGDTASGAGIVGAVDAAVPPGGAR